MSFYSASIAQISSLPVPLNIRHSIDKGTRTLDGKPGEAYWQNSSIITLKQKLNRQLEKLPDRNL